MKEVKKIFLTLFVKLVKIKVFGPQMLHFRISSKYKKRPGEISKTEILNPNL